eukprot:365282-Chlamydomonas_euryale.AAC.13
MGPRQQATRLFLATCQPTGSKGAGKEGWCLCCPPRRCESTWPDLTMRHLAPTDRRTDAGSTDAQRASL